MPDGNKIALFMVIIISTFVLLFGTGAWKKFHDWSDKKIEGGDIVLVNGLKCLRPE